MAIEEKALRMPKQIKPGDTLGVVAPSMPVKPEEKEKLKVVLGLLKEKVRGNREM